MLAFNLGFAYEKTISGGDVLFIDLVRHLKDGLDITVVIPRKGCSHWRALKSQCSLTIEVLKPNLFDKCESPLTIFCSYLVRSFQSLKFLGQYDFYYSCSDVWPDVFPPFVLRFLHPKVLWLSRVYHIYLSPKYRKGNNLVNLVSTKLQKISWLMMRLKSQKILALNEKLARDLKAYGFKNLPVLGAGVDLDVIKKCEPAKRRFDGIFLGRLSRTKGVYDLLDVWAQVVQKLPDAKLAIIGGGPESMMKGLGARSEELGLGKNVEILGFIDDKRKVYSLLKSAKVFLFPSHEEGWGLVVAEAMACGLPVVGYDLDIFGAVFKKGFVTAPLFDKSGFAMLVLKIFSDENHCFTLSKAAISEAQRFDNKKVAQEFKHFLLP